MNSLIKIGSSKISGQQKQTINARELHQFIESKREFATWIKQRITRYGFTENEDFTIDKIVKRGNSGSQTYIDYHITLDMAKELAMIENNEKGRQVRKYFIECEKQLKTQKNNDIVDRLLEKIDYLEWRIREKILDEEGYRKRIKMLEKQWYDDCFCQLKKSVDCQKNNI